MTHANWRYRAGTGLVATALAVAVTPAAATAAPTLGEVRQAGGATAIDGSYIVVFKDSAVSTAMVGDRARSLAARHGGAVGHTFRNALRGFEARLSAAQARRLAADPAVSYVEQDHTAHLVGTQSPTPSWGLDRVDQHALPLDDSYTYPTTAAGVRAYIIDTGVRNSHQDFGGRAVSGIDTVDDDNDAGDCHGHGTHVAGTVGGTSYGIAKGVTVVGVRVMNCAGSGAWSDIIAGIDWVAGDHDAGELAVANMSIGGARSQSVNDAVTAAIADGVNFAVAAGNDDSNACNSSPASTPEAITVGATDSGDARAYFSNFGSCLDLFAPGVSITSAWHTGDTATNTASGTSMASPHVAGVAALIQALNPSFTPQQVRDKMVADATTGVVTDPATGSPNRLLYVGNTGDNPGNDFSVSVSPATGSTDPGGSLTATVATATTSGKAQTVALSASGLPDGASASFDPPSVTSGESSTMTISTKDTTPSGTYPITITGTGDEATRTTTYTLTVNGGTPGGCGGYESRFTGSLTSGASDYQPDGSWFYTGASGAHEACLDGPDGVDFDLYLQKWTYYGWTTVARGTSPGPDETLSYNGTSGYYRYRVHAYSGSGDYTLGYDAP